MAQPELPLRTISEFLSPWLCSGRGLCKMSMAHIVNREHEDVSGTAYLALPIIEYGILDSWTHLLWVAVFRRACPEPCPGNIVELVLEVELQVSQPQETEYGKADSAIHLPWLSWAQRRCLVSLASYHRQHSES